MIRGHDQIQRVVHQQLLIKAEIVQGRGVRGHHHQGEVRLLHLQQPEAFGGIGLNQTHAEAGMAIA